MRGLRRLGLIVGLGLAAGCPADETTFVLFNADDQTFVVAVTPEGTPPGDPAEIALVSNVGQVPIGTAILDPGSGPVGTEHYLWVEIFDDFEDLVGRVSVEVESEAVSDLDGDEELESRGVDEYTLRRDSADPGVFALTLQSQGAVDEVREDRFTILVWTPDAEIDGE